MKKLPEPLYINPDKVQKDVRDLMIKLRSDLLSTAKRYYPETMSDLELESILSHNIEGICKTWVSVMLYKDQKFN